MQQFITSTESPKENSFYFYQSILFDTFLFNKTVCVFKKQAISNLLTKDLNEIIIVIPYN